LKSYKIVFIATDLPKEYNSEYYRCYLPWRSLRNAGYPATFIHVEDWIGHTAESNAACNEADLIIIQRNLFGSVPVEMLYWMAKGKRCIIDLDDGYQFMKVSSGSPSAEFWLQGITQPDASGQRHKLPVTPLQTLTEAVKACGFVSSPSKVICQDWQHLAKTYYLPNYLNLQNYGHFEVNKDPGKVVIGYFQSSGHMDSWRQSGVDDAIVQLAAKYKQVVLMIVGDPTPCREARKKIAPARRVEFGWIPSVIMGKALSFFDIGLIPIASDYDNRRSPLKSMEYSCFGLPWIGSDAPPTWELCQSGTLVQNTTEAWYKALEDHILHIEDYRARAVDDAPLYQERYDAMLNADTLMGIYGQIIEGVQG
jgi:glycosyltransferase involved in cell wall biosynthesis